MTVYGKQGLRELAEQNLAKAHYLAGKLKPRFSGPFFNEFVARAEGKSPDEINQALLEEEDHRRPAAGPLLSGTRRTAMLLCATEMIAARAIWMRWRRSWHCMIKKVRSHISQNEPLLFERSSPGKNGYQLPELDVPAVDPAEALGAANVRAEIEGFPGSQRSGGHPPLHAALHLELRHRSRHVSARLLHHEVQPAHQRAGGAHRRPGLGASLSARSAVAGLHGSDGAPGSGACARSPAWTRSRCSRPPARTAS